jgi:hypothetical protein
MRITIILSGLVLMAACRQPLTAEQKLNAWVIHQRKMETVLQDVQMDCDSSAAATLRYRLDSLQTALAKPVLAPARPAHHAHHQTDHHHHRTHPQ